MHGCGMAQSSALAVYGLLHDMMHIFTAQGAGVHLQGILQCSAWLHQTETLPAALMTLPCLSWRVLKLRLVSEEAHGMDL